MNYWYWAEIKEAGRTVLYAGPVSVVVPTIGGGATFVFPVFPNPTPNAATIRYTLGTEDTGGGQASVSLAIYDLRGRLVRILVRAEQPAGIHTVEWDGRADDGTRLSPGVYYYRFRGGAHAQQSRIVLLR
jgi:hypothetical protein